MTFPGAAAGQPLTQGQMEAYIGGLGLLITDNANAHMNAFLAEQRFITAADVRQLGYATNNDVRQTVIELVQAEA